MIGIIQKVLLDLLEQTGGLALKQAVLARVNLHSDTTFRIDQNYSDEQCLALIHATIAETGLPENDVNQLYAKAFIAEAQRLFPRFFEMSKSSEEFLLRQATVHAVMASGLQHAEERKQVTDKFNATRLSQGIVQIEYRSANRLCGLFKALAHEVADFYNEQVFISCTKCAKKGSDACSFTLQWPSDVLPENGIAVFNKSE